MILSLIIAALAQDPTLDFDCSCAPALEVVSEHDASFDLVETRSGRCLGYLQPCKATLSFGCAIRGAYETVFECPLGLVHRERGEVTIQTLKCQGLRVKVLGSLSLRLECGDCAWKPIWGDPPPPYDPVPYADLYLELLDPVMDWMVETDQVEYVQGPVAVGGIQRIGVKGGRKYQVVLDPEDWPTLAWLRAAANRTPEWSRAWNDEPSDFNLCGRCGRDLALCGQNPFCPGSAEPSDTDRTARE